jgi:hypothetical protein
MKKTVITILLIGPPNDHIIGPIFLFYSESCTKYHRNRPRDGNAVRCDSDLLLYKICITNALPPYLRLHLKIRAAEQKLHKNTKINAVFHIPPYNATLDRLRKYF